MCETDPWQNAIAKVLTFVGIDATENNCKAYGAITWVDMGNMSLRGVFDKLENIV